MTTQEIDAAANESAGGLRDWPDADSNYERSEHIAGFKSGVKWAAALTPPTPTLVGAADGPPKWVPVGERLPKNCKKHWVWVERDGKKPKAKISRLNPIKQAFYVKYDKTGSFPIEEVKYWAPITGLPAAPAAMKGASGHE